MSVVMQNMLTKRSFHAVFKNDKSLTLYKKNRKDPENKEEIQI